MHAGLELCGFYQKKSLLRGVELVMAGSISSIKEREEEKGIMASVGKDTFDLAAKFHAAASPPSITSSSRAPKPPPPSPAPKPKPVRSSDPYANYTTAASFGYADPNTEEVQWR
ncbi:hypothetical protein BS17DRAFT_764676 [Gyrodon lividus]|nr:hypothetical protein BS17DRAFT_764676 [Gyrodon lividus]